MYWTRSRSRIAGNADICQTSGRNADICQTIPEEHIIDNKDKVQTENSCKLDEVWLTNFPVKNVHVSTKDATEEEKYETSTKSNNISVYINHDYLLHYVDNNFVEENQMNIKATSKQNTVEDPELGHEETDTYSGIFLKEELDCKWPNGQNLENQDSKHRISPQNFEI